MIPFQRKEYWLTLCGIISFLFFFCGVVESSEQIHNHPIRCATSTITEPNSVAQPKIAVAFFGISRNLQLTMPLFEKYIFNALSIHGIDSDVFWHTVTKPSISNKHTTELNQELNRFDVQLMNPCVFELADERLVKDIEFESFKKSRFEGGSDTSRYNRTTSSGRDKRKKNFDPFQKFFHDNYESLKNMLCAFHSQYRLQQMISSRMQSLNITYDAILLIRPDTGVFFQDIDLPLYLSKIRNGEMQGIWTPNFQRWKGLNDRFAYGDVKSMFTYLQRGERYKVKADKLTEGSGEKFLKKYLRRHHIQSHDSTVRVMRVRASGVVAIKDCLDEDIRREHGEQLRRCVMWVPLKDGGTDEECRIRNIQDC